MVTYRKNKNWKAIHISLDLKKSDKMDEMVEVALAKQMSVYGDASSWKTIDIVDTHIFSSTYNPSKETTFLDMLVFIAELAEKKVDMNCESPTP